METKKINDFEIEVTKQAEPIVNKYERSFIENQIKTITEDRDKYIALRNTEIEECVNILKEMDKLNIITKIEPVIEPVEEVKIEPTEEIIKEETM